jgi:putative tricarboxylic transport membrane protein
MRALDNKETIGGLLILAFSLVYLRYALVLPLDPLAGGETFTSRTMPIGLSIAAITLSIVQIFISVQARDGERVSDGVRGFNWLPTLLLILLMAAYSLLFDFLGFIVASYLFLHIGFLILGERRVLRSVIVAGGLVAFLWFMLVRTFGLYLDSGDVFRALVG